ncbi:trans-sialidase [Trypanosoma cruzi]|nr:trans-sialidase [Trypanosoma cruzi]
MHAQNAHCSGFECFFCSVCWRLRVAAASFSGHEGKEEREGARTASHSSCGCDAHGGLRLLWRAASFWCALLRRCAVRLRMSFVMRVGAGHVFPERWAAAICRWRLV